ncbi:protein ZINC INDUCED FACILITATOR-LIKE 1-like [Phragmites australis]|uniref:protein ZINC INDUCED FACILITATOR-LIKE 1-like n=1 Tax=Phragmites australis TaxID=29695 RepID=UPI002D76F591|nr:protein ZINC INDUCED FACILITATOR-LIKE 1-like [Phragmites australis]XP_062208706.1 protein ZINC INDUCED FACILITATOR-LIKE 1-like [Phragmites australis]
MAAGENGAVAGAAAPLLGAARRKHHEGCPGCRLDEINKTSTGIPYLNFFYIWVVCLTASMPIQSLFPYLYFMIRDLRVAKQEQDIGFYAGFVGATYFLGRTISAVPWGMFADKYGRKPCIVISILSVIVFNTLFGLSTTYWMAIVTRGLLGLLCGILGPIKAYASEVCRKEHQALGISLVTSSRAIALVVGPAIGGFLAQPAHKYPNLFSEESIFGRFPYFLPCFVISVLAAGSCIACIWLPETLHFHHDDKVEVIDELEAQVGDSNLEGGKAKESRGESTKNLLKNWQLMSAVILYCIFSLHDTAYLEIFSLWAVSSRKFRGLSLTSQDVGTVLAFSGFGVLVYQLAIYPFLAKHFGPIKPFRPAAILSILLLATYPFMANLHGPELKILINIASLLKNMFAATITIACNILQNTAVTQEQRGVANGISVTLMSMFKAVAPAAAGILFSLAQKHISGLFLPGDQILFLMLNLVSVIGLVLTFKPFFSLPNAMGRL